MRICMITNEFPPKIGGMGGYVYNLSKEMVKRGHKVTVVTRGSWRGLQAARFNAIDVYRVPYIHIYPLLEATQGIFQNRILKGLSSELDVVHVHHPISPKFNTALPIMVTLHASVGLGSIDSQNFYSSRRLPGPLFSAMRSYVRSGERKILERADCITTVSNALVNELHSLHGIDVSSITVLGNGVDTELFKPPKTRSDEKTVLYTGRLYYNKGLLDLVKAAKHVLHRYPETSFVLTGRGPIEGQLRRIIARLNISKNFRFTGFVEESTLIELYQSATVYVFPSYYEGLPTSMLEAMACGTPVVVTAINGILEVVKDGQNGFTVPVKDPMTMANAIARILSDNDLQERIGRAARVTIKEGFTWEIVAKRASECYRSLAKSGESYKAADHEATHS